jgi:hypothetical protein
VNCLLPRCLPRPGFGFCFLPRDPLPLQPFAFRLQKLDLCLDKFERRMQVLALRIALQRGVEAAQRFLFLPLRQQLPRILDGLCSRGPASPCLGLGFLARDPLVFLPLLFGFEFFNRLAHHRDLEVKIGAIRISALDRQQDFERPFKILILKMLRRNFDRVIAFENPGAQLRRSRRIRSTSDSISEQMETIVWSWACTSRYLFALAAADSMSSVETRVGTAVRIDSSSWTVRSCSMRLPWASASIREAASCNS